MYKYLIDSAGHGLNGLALLALLTLFTVFTIAFAAAFLRRRSFLDHMASLPLDLDGAAAPATSAPALSPAHSDGGPAIVARPLDAAAQVQTLAS